MTGFEERCLRCFRCSRSGSFSLLSFLTLRFSLAGDASARSTSGSLSLVGMVLFGVAHLGWCVMGSSCARNSVQAAAACCCCCCCCCKGDLAAGGCRVPVLWQGLGFWRGVTKCVSFFRGAESLCEHTCSDKRR